MFFLIFLKICDALRDLVTFGKHSSVGIFHVFKIVQIVPNCAKRLIFRTAILQNTCEQQAQLLKA